MRQSGAPPPKQLFLFSANPSLFTILPFPPSFVVRSTSCLAGTLPFLQPVAPIRMSCQVPLRMWTPGLPQLRFRSEHCSGSSSPDGRYLPNFRSHPWSCSLAQFLFPPPPERGAMRGFPRVVFLVGPFQSPNLSQRSYVSSDALRPCLPSLLPIL